MVSRGRAFFVTCVLALLAGFSLITNDVIEAQGGPGFFSRLRIGTSCQVRVGSGSPEGALTAAICSLYLQTDGTTGTVLWIKESGSGNTGWRAQPALASPVTAATGGTGQNTSASSGVVSVNSGSWIFNSIGGSNRVLYTTAGNTVGNSANFTFDPATNRLAVNGLAHVFGSATPNTSIATYWTGAFSGSSVFFLDTTLTGGVGQTLTGSRFIPTIVEAGSGTHARIATSWFDEPQITAGGATVTDAATVYIANAPSGTFTNPAKALHVDNGPTYLDGSLFLAGVDVSNVTIGAAAGYKVARGSTALDGSNPTTVATGLTTVVSCTSDLLRTTALTSGTALLTHAAASGANVDFYGWVLAGTASTGTETFEWICIGT